MTDAPPPRNVETVVTTLHEVITALRDEVADLADNERRSRQRLAAYLLLLGVVAFGSVVGIGITYSQGGDVKTIVHYISDCQKPGSECRKRNDDIIARAVTAVFDSQACVLQTPQERRTDESVRECRDKFLGVRK